MGGGEIQKTAKERGAGIFQVSEFSETIPNGTFYPFYPPYIYEGVLVGRTEKKRKNPGDSE